MSAKRFHAHNCGADIEVRVDDGKLTVICAGIGGCGEPLIPCEDHGDCDHCADCGSDDCVGGWQCGD